MSGQVASQPFIDGVRQLDIVKFALPLAKIFLHPIFAVRGKHTNFFMSKRAALQPYKKKRRFCKLRLFFLAFLLLKR